MQFVFWLLFLIGVAIAIFAVQNSAVPPVMMKFLIWQFETSLIYAIFGAISMGVFVSLLFDPKGYQGFYLSERVKEADRKC